MTSDNENTARAESSFHFHGNRHTIGDDRFLAGPYDVPLALCGGVN